jgi:hypothetical protein
MDSAKSPLIIVLQEGSTLNLFAKASSQKSLHSCELMDAITM